MECEDECLIMVVAIVVGCRTIAIGKEGTGLVSWRFDNAVVNVVALIKDRGTFVHLVQSIQSGSR